MGEEIRLTASDGGQFAAYLALPARLPAPALVVLPEVFNTNPHIRSVADGYAADGFVALAPDVFWRQEAACYLAYTDEGRAKARALWAELDTDQFARDLGDIVASLRARPDCTGKVGVMGFCLGGKFAYLASTRLPVDAAVSYYGVQIDQHLDEAGKRGCPILMHFDGDRIDVSEMSVGKDIPMVVVDLKASKDTREILNRLNHCYPFAENEQQRQVHQYLGPLNREIVTRAAAALRAGDAATLGALMTEAQSLFDQHLQAACPEQLTAPALHRLLTWPALQPLIHGGKGVGSQGDGSAQLIARDPASQQAAIRMIENDLGMACLPLVLHAGKRVRKAVIPAAGFGTRHFPATKAVKKELFPVVGCDGRTRPAILTIIEEALAAGVEEVAVLVQPRDREMFQEIFGTPPSVENYNKLSRADQQYCDYLMDVGRRVTFLAQESQEGFGHAVYSAHEWIGSEPFLLMLGDHLFTSDTTIGCARQLIDTFEKTNCSVVGLLPAPAAEVRHFGCATGTWREPGRTLDITAFVEKPDAEYAREKLEMPGLPADHFLTVFGLYVLKPDIFALLGENIRRNLRERGEFQLTSCLDLLRRNDGFIGQIVQGKRYDIGNPAAYLASLNAFSCTPTVRASETTDARVRG